MVAWEDLLIMIEKSNSSHLKYSIIIENSNDAGLQLGLYYALYKFLSFNIKNEDLERGDISYTTEGMHYYNIFDCLDYLSVSSSISDADKQNIRYLLYSVKDSEIRNLYKKLLLRTLNIGLSIDEVNELIPNLIPLGVITTGDKNRLCCRGQTNDGIWVKGYFFRTFENGLFKGFIMPFSEVNEKATEVILSTVGECTYYDDKKETLIFEGDELSFEIGKATVVFNSFLRKFVCKFSDGHVSALQDCHKQGIIVGNTQVNVF